MSRDSENKNTDEKPLNEMDGHSYDGITECDNPMPNWWVWTFFLTIVFGIGYFVHYGVGMGPTLNQELAEAMIEIEKLKSHTPAGDETEESLTQAMAQNDSLTTGAAVYAGRCAVCHGQNLQGVIGPNLTDSYWIHGIGSRVDTVKMVRQGVPDKGMPPWEGVLKKEEVYAVTAYILSKRGSNPMNAKAPQGNLVQ